MLPPDGVAEAASTARLETDGETDGAAGAPAAEVVGSGAAVVGSDDGAAVAGLLLGAGAAGPCALRVGPGVALVRLGAGLGVRVGFAVGVVPAASRNVTGVNTSLVALALPCAPMVNTPQVSFRQSTVRLAPVESV